MLMVRAKREGAQGRIFYNQLVQFFWDDVEHKMLLMKVDDVTIKVHAFIPQTSTDGCTL